ncbi:MAG: aminotransferase class I/II [Bacteroidia bacterium]|nr:MAG: aminotransferase class I/II [Bacteroidia bacterium]PIE86510.1 MAG: aminotransferase class I/II [Bacteroidia bacterium]
MLFGHGSDIYKFTNKIVADFSSNVWYEGMPDALREHLKNKLSNIEHYPSPDAGELARALADLHQLSASNILPTNGATEAFYLIAQCFSKTKTYIFYPSFSEYEDAAKVYQHRIAYIHKDKIDSCPTFDAHSLVWIGNPNNPEGTILSVDLIKRLCTKNTQSYFVIDEAYAELFHGFESAVFLLRQCANLLIVRSLTKTFAIPGIRLGYVMASEQITGKIKTLKMPWSVNALAIEAGLFLLSDYKNRLPNTQKIAAQSKAFQEKLADISGLSVQASTGNYCLLKLAKGKAGDLKNYLIENEGLLIRDASNFKGLDQAYFRVSLQEESHNCKLINAIETWISTL